MKSKKIILSAFAILLVCVAALLLHRDSEHDGHSCSEEHVDEIHKHDTHNCEGEHEDHDGHLEHNTNGAHEDHDEHQTQSNDCTEEDGHSHSEHAQAIELTDEEIKEIGLKTAFVESGSVDVHVDLAGEIRVNQDRMAHIVPRVEGVVTQVNKSLGDKVIAGEAIAVIESRELADAKAGYLAAVERYTVSKMAFEREEKLWKDKISSEQDYLNQKQAMTEAIIEKRSAQQKLLSIGFDKKNLEKLLQEPEQLLTRFEIKAPFEGTVIEKHIVLGELVKTETPVYVIADLSSVWVDMQIYPKDLKDIKKGQPVQIYTDTAIPPTSGIIDYVGPIVAAESRTALARIVLPNESGVFRPGLFVTGKVAVLKTQPKVIVPKNAIQSLEGKKCVFIKDGHGFEPAFVVTGADTGSHVEILSGLVVGQEYVIQGGFELKSKIVTSTLDSHAGHGH